MEGGRTSAPHWRLRAGRGARLRPRPDAAPPKNGENNGRGRPICGLPLDHRRSKSDCDWTPVEDEGDHTPSTDLNSASPIPTVTGAQHLGVKLSRDFLFVFKISISLVPHLSLCEDHALSTHVHLSWTRAHNSLQSYCESLHFLLVFKNLSLKGTRVCEGSSRHHPSSSDNAPAAIKSADGMRRTRRL